VHHNARRTRLRFDVRIHLALIQSRRVRDGRDRRREHLEEGKQYDDPRETRIACQAHAGSVDEGSQCARRLGAAVHTHHRVTCWCTVEYPSTFFMSHLTRMRIVAARSRWLPALVLVGTLGSMAEAQGSTIAGGEGIEPGWRISGEVGGIFGGQWLSGASAPRVSTAAGLALSVSGVRWTTGRAHFGISARGAMQPITMDEAGTRWSGGTATDVQLLGTVAYAIRRSGHVHSDVELGGGISFITGTREVFPFSET
jgi:hypothetical protein